MAQICVAVPDELKKELEDIAKKEDRKLSYVVRKVLQDYLDGRVETRKE